MKAQKFNGVNLTFAEDQKEYADLPAMVQDNNIATFCFRLTAAEIKEVGQYRKVWITILTFGAPAHPKKLSIVKPEFPVNVLGFQSDVDEWGLQGLDDDPITSASTSYPMTEEDLKQLLKTRCFWLSVATFGAALQPIMSTISKPPKV